ncbi:choice-of-anchor B family protein [Tahibacter soli]|uniref:Choice-of-anchor B family protein n=1 Tax=Tahibacter soli TaxID=2983605 RepID=A0A9X3YJA5_9GAMM|nr:choice-of-anchor B family protein [Tahibacter soli]MDC8012250.1 choice-of-anchor B family protein [Tahibacter soli]
MPIVHAGRLLALGLVVSLAAPAVAQEAGDGGLSPLMQRFADARPKQPRALAPRHATPCVNGMAGEYPCSNIDLLAFVPVAEFAASSTNSLWGWTDAQSGIEYALVGANNGTAFYDLSQPSHPRYLGKLPTHTGNSLWRDVRVYDNKAYVVSDNNGSHGLQVFDLTRLRGVTTPQTFTEDAHRNDFGRGHTIAINEDTGYAYVAGSNTCAAPTATGGLRMYKLTGAGAPSFAGCVTTGGYTHETQCFTYHGPDTAHAGKEVCLNANGPTDRFAIVDVTNKSAPVTLSSTAYAGAGYPHQAWFTDDFKYALLNDELDETSFGHNAQTLVFDVSDLDAPTLVGRFDHGKPVIDHNLYVHGQYVYESNYESGLRILRLGNLSQAELTEVAYFDVYPQSDQAEFNGNWNNYRFPGSGNVIATGIDEGFFVLEPRLCTPPVAPAGVTATANGDQRIDLAWTGSPGALWRVERAQGGCGGTFRTLADSVAATSYSDTSASGSVTYGYRVVERDASGRCASVASTCVEAQTTGQCTAPPVFGGLAQATTPFTSACRIDLSWNDAAPACGGPATYAVHRSSTPGFAPSAANLVATGFNDAGYADSAVPSGQTQYYVVRAIDETNDAHDANTVELSAKALGPNVDGAMTSGAEPGDPPFDSATSSLVGNVETPAAVRHAGWHTSMSRVHAGAQSFWSTSANNLCVSLVTQPIELTAGQSSELSFWSVWDIPPGADGGVVEASTDNGTTWTRLTPVGGYPGSITSGGALCGIAQGSAAYAGLGQFSWTQHRVDLAAYAGQTVQLRWLYRTDAATAGNGWYVDDVAVTHAQVAGACASGVDLIFEDDFDL